MIVDIALREREATGHPIRVGMVGAGASARAIALQLGTPVPGIRLVAIANRTPEHGERAFREAGFTDWGRPTSAREAERTIAHELPVLTDDPSVLTAWRLSDDRLVALATEELSKIGIIDAVEVLDPTVLRMEKTCPAYFGTYDRFCEIRDYVDRYGNLFLIGRNGMHRYNNQDHSMLTAMTAVDYIIAGKTDKSGLWAINTEMDYHEEKGGSERRS